MESVLQYKRYIIIDIILFLAIYFVPALSHAFAFPFYYLDPMRFAILLGFLLLNNKRNAYLLAITLPIFSYLMSDHPYLLKSILIIIELNVNVLLLYWCNKHLNVFASVFLSIWLSKLVYYVLKYLFVQFGLLQMSIISTPIVVQLIVSIVWASVFYVAVRKGLKL